MHLGYTNCEIEIKTKKTNAKNRDQKNTAAKEQNIFVVNWIKGGGEDRTRTCKRSLAVVFKTTALPIRLPLRTR